MKTSRLASVALFVACCLSRLTAGEAVPESFPTRDAASKYAAGLFAGGDVDVLKVGNEDVMIVTVHGSGVPDLLIAVYRKAKDTWSLAATVQPTVSEFHRTLAEGSTIVVVGQKSGQKQILLRIESKEQN